MPTASTGWLDLTTYAACGIPVVHLVLYARGLRSELNRTNSAGEVRGYSLAPIPDSPGLEVHLENVKRERGEFNDVDVDEGIPKLAYAS